MLNWRIRTTHPDIPPNKQNLQKKNLSSRETPSIISFLHSILFKSISSPTRVRVLLDKENVVKKDSKQLTNLIYPNLILHLNHPQIYQPQRKKYIHTRI